MAWRRSAHTKLQLPSQNCYKSKPWSVDVAAFTTVSLGAGHFHPEKSGINTPAAATLAYLEYVFQLSALHWPPNGHWVSSFNLFVLHWFMFPPILQPKALMSWTPKLHLMPWFNPQGVHMISSLLILKTVGLSLRNVTNSTTNRNKFRRNLSIPCSPWSCMVVWSHERRDKFKSANPFVHHRKQHSSFASSRVQATKIMNGFLSAEMSMNFTSGVEMTPGQSKVMSVLFDFSRPGML